MTKKKLSTDEALAEVFRVSFDYAFKSDKLYLEHLDHRIKFLQSMIERHMESEPCKLFKNAHKKWEEELEDWEQQLADAYKNLNDEVIEQRKFIENLKSN